MYRMEGKQMEREKKTREEKRILFVNACVREGSRTLYLARYLLGKLEGRIEEVNLEQEHIEPLMRRSLAERDALLKAGDREHEMLRYARAFAEAEEIVIAAPYWDLGFPALLKIYLEAVTAAGVTFTYEQGIPKGLCRAKRLLYITTAGGPIFADFGYSYVKMLAEGFYGISDTLCFKAENLDVEGADVEGLLMQTKQDMDKRVQGEQQ